MKKTVHRSRVIPYKNKKYIISNEENTENINEDNESESNEVEQQNEEQPIIWREARCGSKNCIQPKGKGPRKLLSWTECESCKLWIHDIRLGLSENDENLRIWFAMIVKILKRLS